MRKKWPVLFLILVYAININTAFAVNCEELDISKKVCSDLSIIDIASSPASEYVTREEMLLIVGRLIGINDDEMYLMKSSSSKYNEDYYTNIPEFTDWHPDNMYIDRLYECSVFKGCGADRFRPYDNCTWGEAIAFIVRALGYEPYVKAFYSETYPDGYGLTAMDELGIIDSVPNYDEPISYDDAIILAYKSLFATQLVLANYDAYCSGTQIHYINHPCLMDCYWNPLNDETQGDVYLVIK